MSETLAFVRLQQLISPTLPVGAFTYSQGMEWAVEAGWLKTAAQVQDWLYNLMHDSLSWLELPLLIRLYRACEQQDQQQFSHYAALAIAGRETAELRREEEQRARALLTVLNKLPDSANWPLLQTWQAPLLQTALAGFALACQQWQIRLDKVLPAYVWGWLDNMVCVAVKLIPLGQTDGQTILFHLSEHISDICAKAQNVLDDDIGASTTALAIASSLHETQYCRLFRS